MESELYAILVCITLLFKQYEVKKDCSIKTDNVTNFRQMLLELKEIHAMLTYKRHFFFDS